MCSHNSNNLVRSCLCGISFLPALIFWAWPTIQAFAQPNAAERAKEIQRALQRADYQFASDLADSAIANFRQFSPAQLAEIHALRALVALEQNQSAIADAHFMSALQLTPELQLDPIFFSPTVHARFEQLRAKLPKAETPVRVETRYVIIPDPRIKAAGKSLVLPGWGQRAKGHRTRGLIFTSATAALATATLATHFLRASAEDDYRKANAQNAGQRYDTFNRYHLLRNNLALGFGLMWSANVLEALLTPVRTSPVSVGIISSELPSSNAFLLAVAVKF